MSGLATDGGPLRILFAGTPDIARIALEILLRAEGPETGSDYTVAGVLCNPDRPAGRSGRVVRPPTAVLADSNGLPVLQPERLDASARGEVRELNPDLLVVVAYGRIFGPRFLELFPRGGINLHPSLLPRHRGPSPLQAAILAGDRETGVTIQVVAREMDAGEILLQEATPIESGETVSELHDRLATRGGRMLVDAVRAIAAGRQEYRSQDHAKATYCSLIDKAAGEIDFSESAATIERMVRAYTPWPGVRCWWGERALQLTAVEALAQQAAADPAVPGEVRGVDSAKRILVQTADGVLAIERLKLQNRAETDARAFLNGHPGFVGSILTGRKQ